MCKYCEKDSILMQKEVCGLYGIGPIGKGGYISKYTLCVKYDTRGYLRLINNDDNCLDHGEKIKANYCFNCGRELHKKSKAEQALSELAKHSNQSSTISDSNFYI